LSISKHSIASLLLFFLFIPLAAGVAQYHSLDAKQQSGSSERPRVKRPGRIELASLSSEIPDSWLVDQDGKKVRFYSDLVKDKVVVINFFFTSCNYVCPMQARSFVRLKERLAGRLGRDIFFISISKDPENDTPEKLSKWAKAHDVSAGWTLVTGEQPVIKKLLRDIAFEGVGQGMHESLILIGNDRTAIWLSTDGLQLPDELVKSIDKVSRSE